VEAKQPFNIKKNNDNKRPRRHVANPGLGLRQKQQYAGVKPINGIITLPLLAIGYSTTRRAHN
jgi:hypothetical protein